MRYWYIIYFSLTLFSSGLKDRFQEQLRKYSNQEPESPSEQSDQSAEYLKFHAAHAELVKNQKTEPKKNDPLRLQEIKVLVGRILQDLESNLSVDKVRK